MRLKSLLEIGRIGTLLEAQQLRFCASNAGDAGSIPGHRTSMSRGAAKQKKINWEN